MPGTPATPKADPIAVCDVIPRSREEISVLLADTGIATPPATTAGQTLPAGTPAEPSTAAAMEETVRLWLSCQNAGEPLRAWALFSDGYLHRLLARQGPSAINAAEPSPAADAAGGAVLLEIRGERELPDGRFGATVVIAYPAVPMPKTFFFSFIETDGRFLIDGILGEISFSVP